MLLPLQTLFNLSKLVDILDFQFLAIRLSGDINNKPIAAYNNYWHTEKKKS